MSARPQPDLPLTARLFAALADVPAGKKPNFGAIARQLHVTPAQVSVAVWQLADAGRVDRQTLRPTAAKRATVRDYCAHPDACVAGRAGACRLCPAPPPDPKRSHRPVSNIVTLRPPTLTSQAVQRLDLTLVWCGQCDRRVTTAKALGCSSRWCKAELPPEQRECKL